MRSYASIDNIKIVSTLSTEYFSARKKVLRHSPKIDVLLKAFKDKPDDVNVLGHALHLGKLFFGYGPTTYIRKSVSPLNHVYTRMNTDIVRVFYVCICVYPW